MATPFVLGAYASLPAPELEADYYQLLAAQPWVSGVEIPYPGQLATQAPLLASRLAEHWNFNTITAIPGTMQHVWKDANFSRRRRPSGCFGIHPLTAPRLGSAM